MTITPEIINREGAANLVLICDHAANFIPDEYAGLGLGEDMLATHIAWDIGAEGVARRLSGLLDCPAILARHSRLVVDTNREIDDPTLILKVSDGVRIYGNENISEKEREKRIASYHTPFHRACDSVIEPRLGKQPHIIGIHTFTRVFGGVRRDLQLAVMWNRDRRLADKFGAAFEGLGFSVGWNQPYSGKDFFYSMDRHGHDNGLLHTTLEVRQDLVNDEAGQEKFATLIAGVFRDLKEV